MKLLYFIDKSLKYSKTHMPTTQELKKLIFLFLSWRTALFLIGVLAPFFFPYKPSFPYFDELLPHFFLPQWIYSWANFDGVHYLTIAEKGYIGTGSIQAFFPLFPFVILHGLKLLFGSFFNSLLFGLLIDNLAALGLVIAWYSFVKTFKGVKTAWLSLLILLLFPTSFFLGALYTEALFFFLIISAFYCAEKKFWMLAGFFGLLASSTRIVGIFIVPSLLIELFSQEFNVGKCLKLWAKRKNSSDALFCTKEELIRFSEKNWLKIIWLSCGVLGTLFYMIFLDINFRDPFYFAHVQASFGSGRSTQVLVTYPQVVYRALHILITARPFNLRYWSYIQEFIAGTLALVLIFLSARTVRFSHLFFALGAFIIPTLTGTFSSMPRYILICFPIYIILAQLLQKNRKLAIVWLTISGVILILNTMLFIQGYWIA